MGEAMIVVHIIHDDGFPLCGFGYGKLPRDWPEGHEWIGREGAETSNCARCRAKAGLVPIKKRVKP
jgi:hypothetical protein